MIACCSFAAWSARFRNLCAFSKSAALGFDICPRYSHSTTGPLGGGRRRQDRRRGRNLGLSRARGGGWRRCCQGGATPAREVGVLGEDVGGNGLAFAEGGFNGEAVRFPVWTISRNAGLI